MNSSMLPKIRLFCDINPGTGSNNATRGLVQSLETLGYDTVSLKVIGAVSCSLDYQRANEYDWLRRYIYSSWPEQEQVNLVHLNPGLVSEFWTAGRLNIAYCAWETDALPKQEFTTSYGEKLTCAKALNKFDQVWVPTNFLIGVFKSSGVTAPIHVVPHALQRELLERPIKPPGLPRRVEGNRVEDADAPTGFYTIGSWNARKDLDALFRAYLMSGWSVGDTVSLDVHAVPQSRDSPSVIGHQITAHEAVKNLAAASTLKMPRFGLHTTPKRYEQILDFHEAHQVFVTCSHGEGFGLPMLEALAMGRIAIGGGPWVDDLEDRIINGGGEIGDIATQDTLVNAAQLRSLPYDSTPITPMPECSGYELDQNWWTTNRGELIAAMKVAHLDLVSLSLNDDAKRVAEVVRKLFSPTAIAEIIKPLLTTKAE